MKAAEPIAFAGQTPMENRRHNRHKAAPACLYCGVRHGTTVDHVPPRCFFHTPLPHGIQLLTVACCETCRRAGEQDETFVRNLFVSTSDSELQSGQENSLTGKRNRSLGRDRRLFERIVETLKPVELKSPEGNCLGRGVAFDFNKPEMDRFFIRLSKALHHHAATPGFIECSVQWHPVTEADVRREFFRRATVHHQVGVEFEYAGYSTPDSVTWFWLVALHGKDFLVKQSVRTQPVVSLVHEQQPDQRRD